MQAALRSHRWFLVPLISKTRGCIARYGLAMAEPGSIEGKTGEFALARTTLVQILEADGVTEAHEVHAHIAGEQHSSRTPQQRDLRCRRRWEVLRQRSEAGR